MWLQWTEQLLGTAEMGLNDVTEGDCLRGIARHAQPTQLWMGMQTPKTLETVVAGVQGLLPALREGHARVMKELEEEQSIVAEIEQCDQDYLKELKNLISDQAWVFLPMLSFLLS